MRSRKSRNSIIANGSNNSTTTMVESQRQAGLSSATGIRFQSAPIRSDSLSSNSSEELLIGDQRRGRLLDRTTESQLHEAVSSIHQARSLSPDATYDRAGGSRRAGGDGTLNTPHTRNKDTANGSNSESAIDSSNDLKDFDCPAPHKMIRKKSGELVRSSLKILGKNRRPSSMPATPNGSKNVHFDRKLEHVRHFLYTEKPAAVSATTSPTQEYVTDDEFPFEGRRRNNGTLGSGSSTPEEYELSIELPNFVPEAQQTDNNGAIIKVETVYLSTDKKSLIGRVAVRNLSFEKHVRVRYTMDYWRTTSESGAEFTSDVRKKQREDGFDRFLFNIKIDDFTGVTDKTMFFCVRYVVGGQEYWDSNGGMNFRVEFHQRAKIRRSSVQRRGSDPPARRALLTLDDDEALRAEVSQKHSHQRNGSDRSLLFSDVSESRPERAAALDDGSEKPVVIKRGRRLQSGSDSFSNRYDFGASLSAAIAAANSLLQGSHDEIQPNPRKAYKPPAYNPYFGDASARSSGDMSPPPALAPFIDSPSSATPLSSGDASPIPGMSNGRPDVTKSDAYQTLLNNYCFFGSARPTSNANHLNAAGIAAQQRQYMYSSSRADASITNKNTGAVYDADQDDSQNVASAVSIVKRSDQTQKVSENASPSLCGLSSLNDSPEMHSGSTTPVIRI
ncbi:hypothetical protein PYCC9005_001874 [Savitreella phatthalungensis]